MKDMPSSADEEMTSLFSQAGIGNPPLPVALRPDVRRIRRWTYATFDVEPDHLYNFDAAVHDTLDRRTRDSLAVGHEGHGVNSYAIGYQLVFGPLVIVSQVLWGGVYTDQEQTSRAVRRWFEQIASLMEMTPPSDRPDGHLLVLYSDFRPFQACGWIGAEEPQNVREWAQRHEQEKPFESARSWALGNEWTASTPSRSSRFVWEEGDVQIIKRADRSPSANGEC